MNAAGDCDTDSCSSWESVVAASDDHSACTADWDVLPKVKSVQSISSSSTCSYSYRDSYRDVLLGLSMLTARHMHNMSKPPTKSRSKKVTFAVPCDSVKHGTTSKDNKDTEFDADSLRDGVKQFRRRNQKGNQKDKHHSFGAPRWYKQSYEYGTPKFEKKKFKRRNRKGKRSIKSACGKKETDLT